MLFSFFKSSLKNQANRWKLQLKCSKIFIKINEDILFCIMCCPLIFRIPKLITFFDTIHKDYIGSVSLLIVQ